MPFLERPPSSDNFLWSSSQQETAEEKSLTCHIHLDGRGHPNGYLNTRREKFIPKRCQGMKEFPSPGEELQKRARLEFPTRWMHSMRNQMSACIFLFGWVPFWVLFLALVLLCCCYWEHHGTTKSLLCFKWLEEVSHTAANCCPQGTAEGAWASC